MTGAKEGPSNHSGVGQEGYTVLVAVDEGLKSEKELAS